jgi:hypothetical protein
MDIVEFWHPVRYLLVGLVDWGFPSGNLSMTLLTKTGRRLGKRQRPHLDLRLPEVRPSILDPALESEPWIDKCPCADTLVLYVRNRPVAMIAGSTLDCISLAMRLNQLRIHAARQ